MRGGGTCKVGLKRVEGLEVGGLEWSGAEWVNKE